MTLAVIGREFGPPESYVLEAFDPGLPKEGEVRVAIKAAGVSYVDVLTAMGKYQFHPPLPFIPGSEAAGCCAATDPAASNSASSAARASGMNGESNFMAMAPAENRAACNQEAGV